MPPENIILLGAGNVGTHLGKALISAGCNIVQVFSRSLEKASQLARELESTPITTFDVIQSPADLYVVAVSDDAIEHVVQSMGKYIPEDSLVIHTSGATPSSVLAGIFPRHGVFYPAQTLRGGKVADFDNIPVCVFAAEKDDEIDLVALAEKISRRVYRLDDEDRAQLHLAAVFANNFSNQLFSIAGDILEERQLPFDLLRPLILETAENIQDADPASVQTGPATRGDLVTLQRHLNMLKGKPEYTEIYKLLSDNIKPGIFSKPS